MLKKQTVWLLTMLSLMIVLSVYYMSSPSGEDIAFLSQDAAEDQTAALTGQTDDAKDQAKDEDVKNTEISAVSSDELFTKIRMEITRDRSLQKERLEAIVASASATTDEKDQAYEDMQTLETLSTKETIVEETLKTEKGYQDVLVRSNGQEVSVTIKAKEHSKAAANEIMQMVYDEFGYVEDVDVKFQPLG